MTKARLLTFPQSTAQLDLLITITQVLNRVIRTQHLRDVHLDLAMAFTKYRTSLILKTRQTRQDQAILVADLLKELSIVSSPYPLACILL